MQLNHLVVFDNYQVDIINIKPNFFIKFLYCCAPEVTTKTMNTDNEYSPEITTRTETDLEVKKHKELPKSACIKSCMSLSAPISRPNKLQNLKKSAKPSQIYAASDGLKSIKCNDTRRAVEQGLLHNIAKFTRPRPTHSHIQPWASHRSGKKLLVLDLDQTICDFGPNPTDKATNEDRRPYLTKFLNTVYEYYDIVIWSATDKLIILDKIYRLKLFSERSKLLFLLDIEDMLKIKLPTKGKLIETRVKPLETVWKRAQGYNSKNTLMVDDRPLNFLSNPKNGLQIKTYNRINYMQDNELLFLSTYLVGLAKNCTDFTTVNHKNWRIYKQTL